MTDPLYLRVAWSLPLPDSMTPLTEKTAGEESRNATGAPRPRILIVEDETLLCWSLANALRKVGYEVTIADAGEKAMETAATGSFDVLITDLKLPRIDGFQVATAVKQRSPATRVIMMSALDERDGHEVGAGKLVDAFIEKPFDLNEMSMLIERLLVRGRR